MVELKYTKHSVGQSAYHLVWRPKYNVKAFRHPYPRKICEDALRHVADKYGFEIYELQVMSDHVHLFVEIPPKYSVSQALQLFKGVSARMFFKKCTLWKAFFSLDGTRKAHLWSPGKFFRSVGNVNADVIQNYISHSNQWDFSYLSKRHA